MPSTANPPWRHDSSHDVRSHQHRMTSLAYQQRPGHLRVLMPTHLGAMAAAVCHPIPAARIRMAADQTTSALPVQRPTADRQVDRQTPRHQGSTGDDHGRLYTS
jgi:hypothetical protein